MFAVTFLHLDQIHSSYGILGALAIAALLGGLLYAIGLVGWLLKYVGLAIQRSIQIGFRLWEICWSWAIWPVYLGLVVGLLAVGIAVGPSWPPLSIACATLLLFMGLTACLAYMFIDAERYQIERGYKAIHNPLLGQELAVHLAKHGGRVRGHLIIGATIGMIGGFSLLNLGLYRNGAAAWFAIGKDGADPTFVDFLAYAVINILRVVDVLNLARSHELVDTAYVSPAKWPAAVLMALFRMFFTVILLQQLFALIRERKLLAETITDFWSPSEPIHHRARNSLPQYGAGVIGPLLGSLRAADTLTREQREQLPAILATIGPGTIPLLLRNLSDPHEHVRAVCAASLGRLHALDAVPRLVALGNDASDVVRQSVVEALGRMGGADGESVRRRRRLGPGAAARRRGRRWLWFGRKAEDASLKTPLEQAIAALRLALADPLPAVRLEAAASLSRLGVAAAAAAPDLIVVLKDEDESVRAGAAEALGKTAGQNPEAVMALTGLLDDASIEVKVAAIAALGAQKTAAGPAVPALVPLLQDRDETVRQAAAAAIAQVGPLNGNDTHSLVEGLGSSDNVVRARTAEALGQIGSSAQVAAPALAEAATDDNDRVRAKAVEALGKLGEESAPVAVPSLVRALRDQDNWVSALAAEALGELGDSADAAVPALTHSLSHANPQVRANAAEALGKMGLAAKQARRPLEGACADEDAAVRAQAVRSLGLLGPATPSTERVVVQALQDADPLARTAAVEAIGCWTEPGSDLQAALAPLLVDPNDQVKVEVTKVLPKLVGPTAEMIEGLCGRLLEDDSLWVQVHAALALGKLGPAAVAAGPALLRVVQTGEATVREQAMRAIAMIQPPETLQAFAAGMSDASADIRMVASAGWMKAKEVPEEVIPALVEALGDPEPQVRANAAHALSRLESLPAAAIPKLVACAADPSDGIRLNAALAMKLAPTGDTVPALEQLLSDANVRVRLVAADALLTGSAESPKALTAVAESLGDTNPRIRKAALELVGARGVGEAIRLALQERLVAEEEPELRVAIGAVLERLAPLAEPQPAEA